MKPRNNRVTEVFPDSRFPVPCGSTTAHIPRVCRRYQRQRARAASELAEFRAAFKALEDAEKTESEDEIESAVELVVDVLVAQFPHLRKRSREREA